MRSGGKLFIVAGIGLAFVAAALAVVAVTSSNPQADANEGSTATVVEALADIPAHTILTELDVIEREVAEEEIQPDAVTNKAAVLGQSYRVQLVTGQQLLASQLEQPGLRNEITPGMRAFSLPVDEMSALSGLIADDDHIDVVYNARINPMRVINNIVAEVVEDETYYAFDDSVGFIPPDEDLPLYPTAGDPGSKLIIRDELEDLEPVAKVMLQNLRVLRVVRPGESYRADGQRVDATLGDMAPADDGSGSLGYLIVEVTNQQAEVLTFMIDERHSYQVMVRAQGDHELESTTGITFQVLASDPDYALPVPGSVTVPWRQDGNP